MRRLRHPGCNWGPLVKTRRNLRVAPPVDHRGEFAVLYTASVLPTVAVECDVLRAGVFSASTEFGDL